MATVTDEDEDMILDEKLDLSQKHLLMPVNEHTESKKPKLTPLSDLTDDKLMEIFGERFSFRFELSKVRLTYETIVEDLQLNGTIQAAASCYSLDPLLKNDFFDIFNRKYNNALRVHLGGFQDLDDIRHCSLPVSSASPIVQISAKLYITTDKVRDVETSADIDADDTDSDDCGVDDDVMDETTAEFYRNNFKNLDKLLLDSSVTEATEDTGEKPGVDINNEAFEVCNACEFLNFSNKPNGGSDQKIIQGKDGSLELYYLALKYAVDAVLEVEFVAPSKETQVYGTVMAYYGKNFNYRAPANLYHLTLFKNKRNASVGRGNVNLMRSVVAVPAQSSLIIKAELHDNTSGNKILSGTWETVVQLDGRPSVGHIASKDYSLNLTVNWKLPSDELKIPSSPIYPPALASNSIVSRLTKRRKFGAGSTSSMADHSTSSMADHFTLSMAHPTSSMADQITPNKAYHPTPSMADPDASLSSMPYHPTSSMTDPDERNRWSLQEELEKVFNASLERIFNPQEAVSCISTCTKEDSADYLCSSVMHIWPELRKTHLYKGPKRAGLALKEDIMGSGMMESCVVCGPGFVKFKLSGKWIAKCIHTMLTVGIETWAPKLSVKKTVIYFLSQNRGEEMHMGHLRSTFIGETLARVLDYCGVVVISKRINDEDPLNINLPDINHLDIKLKMMMEFLIERFPYREDNDEAIGELEALYNESKKFDEDARCRYTEKITLLKGWDQSHQMAWSKIYKIIQQPYQTVYRRLGVTVKEEGKSSYDTHIRDAIKLMTERGREGDKAVTEGPNSPLVYLASLRHALLEEKADWILHVSDEGKRVSIEKCIIGARRAKLIVEDPSKCPLSHAGFGLVQGDIFTRPKAVNIVNMLDEAKSRCKLLLSRQGMADQWTAEEIEHAAEALGIGALKYADLKNNRLANYTFSFDQMLNAEENTAVHLQFTHVRICSIIKDFSKDIKKLKAEELSLKNDVERELGLHLLRFTEVLEELCTFLTPHILCNYVYDLCLKFESLETSVPQVVGSNEETSNLLLCKATEVVMRKCFDLLGITSICKI